MSYPALTCSALALALLVPLSAMAQPAILVNIAPPPLPVYAQPLVPGDGYIWTPGYWSWNTSADDYFWVPGTWVLAPADGQLWTPGYWAFSETGYFWNAGYWGMDVGYYGGLNYGYGYTGKGYQGGRWEGSHFRYNAAASHVDPRVTRNSYTTRVRNDGMTAHASYRVIQGGDTSKPWRSVQETVGTPRRAPTTEQIEHERAALGTSTQRAWVPHGPPHVAATVRPSAFTAPGAEHVRPEAAPRAQARQNGQPSPAQHEQAVAHAAQAHGKASNDWKPER